MDVLINPLSRDSGVTVSDFPIAGVSKVLCFSVAIARHSMALLVPVLYYFINFFP